MRKKEVTKINRGNLWILIGACWLFPVIMILYLPNLYNIIIPIALLLLGIFIVKSPDVDKWFLYKTKGKNKLNEKKKRKTKK